MTELITPTNHIRRARKNLDLSQARLAELVGISQQQVAKLELGKQPLRSDLAVSLARALNVRLEDIVGVTDRPRIPVIGKLSVNDVIVPALNIDAPEYEDAPPFVSPDTLALQVAGDGAWPRYCLGDVIFVSGKEPADDLIGEECAVQLADGTMLLKRLAPGSLPGRYHLLSTTSPTMIRDAELLWARRVEWHRHARRPRQH